MIKPMYAHVLVFCDVKECPRILHVKGDRLIGIKTRVIRLGWYCAPRKQGHDRCAEHLGKTGPFPE